MSNYNKYLNRARTVGLSQAWKIALSAASIWTAIFLFYSYSFSIGSILILNPNVKNRGEPYNGGDVLACLFGIIFGAFGVGGAAPNLKCVVEG